MAKTTWRVKAKEDRRFRSGHPWVYSNELMESPKGLEPGALVELCDAGGKFLARGYGNPASLIAFRAMSRDALIEDPMAPAEVVKALASAVKLRERLGLADVSYRLSFGEADRLPGLVIDRYRLAGEGQVYVVQAHSAGADRIARGIVEILETFVTQTQNASAWAKTTVVLRNDLGVRKLEGLTEEEPVVLKEGVSLKSGAIRIASALPGQDPLIFNVDLMKGQKTGFFLDQAANIQLAALRLSHLRAEKGPLKILDLCTYVGQWGAQLSRVFKSQGVAVEVLAVDGSAPALEYAKQNIEAQGARCETLKGDVLKDLEGLAAKSFDIVISDPPALIKGRKDMGAGTHAYLQLNTQAVRLLKSEGGIVSCSCSGLLEEDEFIRVLNKSAFRNQTQIRWVARGAQSPDHPLLAEFPEGRYLKGWIGLNG